METDHIKDSKGNLVSLKNSLNCQSEGIIYVIRCKKCNMMYVGKTQCTLNHRITQHRSNIKTGKDHPVPNHFNTTCPGMDNFSVVPLEAVPRTEFDTFMGMYSMKELTAILECEQYWTKKLKTLMPLGMNLRKELPPPITFIIKYSDQAGKISKLIKEFYDQLKSDLAGYFMKYKLVTGFKRNKNLKDYLVHAKL